MTWSVFQRPLKKIMYLCDHHSLRPMQSNADPRSYDLKAAVLAAITGSSGRAIRLLRARFQESLVTQKDHEIILHAIASHGPAHPKTTDRCLADILPRQTGFGGSSDIVPDHEHSAANNIVAAAWNVKTRPVDPCGNLRTALTLFTEETIRRFPITSFRLLVATLGECQDRPEKDPDWRTVHAEIADRFFGVFQSDHLTCISDEILTDLATRVVVALSPTSSRRRAEYLATGALHKYTRYITTHGGVSWTTNTKLHAHLQATGAAGRVLSKGYGSTAALRDHSKTLDIIHGILGSNDWISLLTLDADQLEYLASHGRLSELEGLLLLMNAASIRARSQCSPIALGLFRDQLAAVIAATPYVTPLMQIVDADPV